MERLLGKILVFWSIFNITNAEFCLETLENQDEYHGAMHYPSRLRKWDSKKEDFVVIDALKKKGTKLCTVDYATIEDLEGKTIYVAVEKIEPYVRIDKNFTQVSGYIGEIWTNLEKALKFKSIYIKRAAQRGDILMNGPAEVILGAAAITFYNTGHYVYSHAVTTNFYALFALSGGTNVSVWWYTKIFDSKLWITIFFFVIGMTFMLSSMYRVKKNTCQNFTECYDEFNAISLDFLCVLGGLTGQGFQVVPSSVSLRILILTSLMMGVLISGGFCSTLTSYIAIRGTTLPVANLEEVVEKRTHALCVRNASTAQKHVSTLADDMKNGQDRFNGILNTEPCPDMNNMNHFGENLCRSGVVFLEAPDIFVAAYRRYHHRCPIVQLPEQYFRLRIGFLFARRSPYRLIINQRLGRLLSAGILNYLEKKWISRQMPDTTQQQFDFQPVEHIHIQLIFFALCCAVPVSGFICILEIIWFRLEVRWEKKKKTERRLKILAKIATMNFPKKTYSKSLA